MPVHLETVAYYQFYLYCKFYGILKTSNCISHPGPDDECVIDEFYSYFIAYLLSTVNAYFSKRSIHMLLTTSGNEEPFRKACSLLGVYAAVILVRQTVVCTSFRQHTMWRFADRLYVWPQKPMCGDMK